MNSAITALSPSIVLEDDVQTIENTRVLLVEDHRDLAETIVDFLETMGLSLIHI